MGAQNEIPYETRALARYFPFVHPPEWKKVPCFDGKNYPWMAWLRDLRVQLRVVRSVQNHGMKFGAEMIRFSLPGLSGKKPYIPPIYRHYRESDG